MIDGDLMRAGGNVEDLGLVIAEAGHLFAVDHDAHIHGHAHDVALAVDFHPRMRFGKRRGGERRSVRPRSATAAGEHACAKRKRDEDGQALAVTSHEFPPVIRRGIYGSAGLAAVLAGPQRDLYVAVDKRACRLLFVNKLIINRCVKRADGNKGWLVGDI
jgi:hypothetical protein